MIYRIIDKQTKLFKRDDIHWNDNERAIADKCQQGFNQPIWVEVEQQVHDLETDTMVTQLVGHWEDNSPL